MYKEINNAFKTTQKTMKTREKRKKNHKNSRNFIKKFKLNNSIFDKKKINYVLTSVQPNSRFVDCFVNDWGSANKINKKRER